MIRPYTIEVKVPPRLKELLTGAPGEAAVLRALADFSVWLADNKTPLFFDYTDHGVAHVTNVLASVERLIPDEAWKTMSPQDAEAVIVAVLLHDCAMHLSTDGFRSLVESDAPRSKFVADERAWALEYRRFEQEALRWDSKRLLSVFGDTDPVHLIGTEGELSDRQKLLVGEFMRRNHARLAHEIALAGVPGPAGEETRFSPLSGLPENKRDLYGFLARSHNMPIRDAVDKLPRNSSTQFLDVHCPYVMALLRIADYIQIDSARAPTQILQLRGLKSPVSRHEWAKHHAVLELHQQGHDPEALHVITDPKSASIFVGLRSLFKDLQRELDESWASLGEVYGRFDQLATLGLTVRRLISNLDDPRQYEAESRPDYIPTEVRLTTSSAELLHLLVGPLYGNKPSVGIRELVQNSVDACLEMQHQRATSGIPYDPLVEVEVDAASCNAAVVRITDNGVGMTIDTLRDYFLKAGASFRKSAWWAGEYATEENKSLVRRSGRFGVGSLAAFLIGPRISVVTRNYTDATGFGYSFSLGADDDLIEIKRVECEVGTSIEIPVSSASVIDDLLESGSDSYSWYVYGSPKIVYMANNKGEWSQRDPEWTVDEDEPGWVDFEAPDYARIRWSAARKGRFHLGQGRLACNGIFVTDSHWGSNLPDISIAASGGAFSVRHPDILVDDRDGRLPLNVQRDGLVDAFYPFQEALEASIAREYVSRIIATLGHLARPSNIRVCANRMLPVTRGVGAQSLIPVAIWDGGWVAMETEVFKSIGITQYLLDYCDTNTYSGVIASLEDDDLPGWALLPLSINSSGVGMLVGRLRSLIESYSDAEHQIPYRVGMVEGVRVFLLDSVLEAAKKKGGIPSYLMRTVKVFWQSGGWAVLDIGDTSNIDRDCDWESRCLSLVSSSKQISRMFAFVRYKKLSEIVASPVQAAWSSAVPGDILRPTVEESGEPGIEVEEVGEVEEEVSEPDEI